MNATIHFVGTAVFNYTSDLASHGRKSLTDVLKDKRRYSSQRRKLSSALRRSCAQPADYLHV